MSDVECNHCGGYLWKVHFKYKCIRCNRVFSLEEVRQLFVQELIDSCDAIKHNKEIKNILKKSI